MSTVSTAVKSTSTPTVTVRTLAQCEKVISNGVKSFRETGAALKEIRDHKLYTKGSYGSGITWELYLKQKWNMTKQNAQQLIVASEVIQDLKAAGVPEDKLPTSVRGANKVNKAAKAKAKAKGSKKATAQDRKDALNTPTKKVNGDRLTLEQFNSELTKLLMKYAPYVDVLTMRNDCTTTANNWYEKYKLFRPATKQVA